MSEKKEVMEHDPLADIADDDNDNDNESIFGETPNLEAESQPVVNPEGDGVINLDSVLTIAEVSDWQEKMLAVIENNDVISLDGGNLEMIDGAGLQLLAALMKEATEQHVVVSWKAASDPLRQSAEAVGLVAALGLDTTL